MCGQEIWSKFVRYLDILLAAPAGLSFRWKCGVAPLLSELAVDYMKIMVLWTAINFNRLEKK